MTRVAQRYRLTESRLQIQLLWTSHLVGAVLLWRYVDPGWMAWLAALLAALLAQRDCAALRRRRGEVLSIDEARLLIGLEGRGQPYFYPKYKVYACRWFAILKLVDKHQPRTLILNFDSVDNPQTYRQLRHALQALESSRAA